MFEGKHIHFSPLDNKPLCSYSSKLCRQRRLNGYAFCIRHILEDKSAPFKQCSFVTRNNYQKCLNAIPSNQERGYCHSHMQVAGIIPKTERKSKTSASGGTTAGAGNSNNTSSHINGSSTAALVAHKGSAVSKGCTSNDPKSEALPRNAEPQVMSGPKTTPVSVPTVHSNNSSVKNASGKIKANITSSIALSPTVVSDKGKGRVICNKNVKVNGNLINSPSLGASGPGKGVPMGAVDSSVKNELRTKSSKQNSGGNGCFENAGSKFKRRPQNINKSCNRGGGGTETILCSSNVSNSSNIRDIIGHDVSDSTHNPIYTLCVRDRWKQFKFLDDTDDNKPIKKLERLKKLRALEKLPLFVETPGLKTESKNSSNIETSLKKETSFNAPIPSGCDVLFSPPFLTKMRLQNKNDNNNLVSNCQVDRKDFRLNRANCEKKLTENKMLPSDCRQWEWETRKEFLARVREAFKRQYKTIRKACKVNEKVDRNEKAFRSALLACAINDSSSCAKILTSDDAKIVNGNSCSADDPTYVNNRKVGSDDKFVRKLTALPRNGQLSHALKLNGLRDDPIMHSCSSQIRGLNGTDIKAESKSRFEDSMMRSSVNQSDKTKLNGASYGNNSTCWQNGGSGTLYEAKKPKGTKKPTKASRTAITAANSQLSKTTPCNNKVNGIENGDGAKKKLKKTSGATAKPVNNKKRKVDSGVGISADLLVDDLQFKTQNDAPMNASLLIDPTSHDLLGTSAGSNEKLLGAPPGAVDLQTVSGLESVLNSASSSDAATTPEGVMTDASFDSPFDHSTSSHPDVEFSDDDLEKSFELQIDPEIAHQASRFLEDTGLTEDDFNDLFPQGDQKMCGRANDLGDLGIDFTSNFDTSDIDYSLFANIFPSFRSNQPESISVNQQF